MAGERYGQVFWPGLLSFQSAHYTISHGIAPGSCIITCNPQPQPPDQAGDLVFTDGYTTITIPDCRLDSMRCDEGGGGTSWKLVIQDRRWKWSQLGIATGTYNQIDSRGIFDESLRNPAGAVGPKVATPTKYVPWTLRTSAQLVELLLQSMGELRYDIYLPPDAQHPLPPVDWDYCNPAHALSQLCQQLGCRIVYQLDPTGGRLDSVLITAQGVGADLPPPITGGGHEGPSYTNIKRPDFILLKGAVIRWQMRMALEAVGEDWDNSIRPINDLSYAPAPRPVRREVWITPDAHPKANDVLSVIVNGIRTDALAGATPTVASECTALALALRTTFAGNAALKTFTAVAKPTYVQLLGPTSGDPFDVQTFAILTDLDWILIEVGGGLSSPWAYGGPPTFSNVGPTDRLTRQQARDKAIKSVWKWYRVINKDPIQSPEPLPLFIPFFSTIPGGSGLLERVEQIVLQDARLEQVLPTDRDEFVIDPKTKKPLVKNYYDGLYRTKPATCYGSIALQCVRAQGLNIPVASLLNTPLDSEIPIGFTLDKERYLVQFHSYVFFLDKSRHVEPDLMLETAIQLRASDTNHPVRYLNTLTFPPPLLGGPPAVISRPDVQLNYIVVYQDAQGNARQIDRVDSDIVIAVLASDYYLRSEALKYEIVEGRDRSYNGLLLIALDGAISQVTWTVGPSGCTTDASRNSEHNYWVPTYPERLRLERLDPNAPPDHEHRTRSKPVLRALAEGRDQ